MKHYIFISANKENAPKLEAGRLTESDGKLACAIINYGYRPAPCLGVYGGVSERSFVFSYNPMDHEQALQVAETLRKSFKQESFLNVQDKGQAFLEFGNRSEFIGILKQTDTKPNSDYSLIDGAYYHVKDVETSPKSKSANSDIRADSQGELFRLYGIVQIFKGRDYTPCYKLPSGAICYSEEHAINEVGFA